MDSHASIIYQLQQQGLLPLFYHADTTLCLKLTTCLYEAGIRAIEFTNRGEAAQKNFTALVSERNASMPDLLLAVGTIRTSDQANRFIEAGADFLISPVFDADVCDTAYINKKLWIPGCMTPTEIHVAEHAGCQLVKLFPGNVLGPSFVSGIKELFPALHFMPTGGVEPNRENISAWFAAGVSAVGMGSKLITSSILEKRDLTTLGNNTKQILDIIKQVRS
ncbi:MAG: bifunctional 4-hydroxy-2-oxoglutarate aldolase/2-dehydro-3-deoxy-phosphogluconate aldolase [Bacteroidetes bacterium]|nr:bifunctional 4-hydroxy-2-oxoglutarate aldolase/2-dehydro-3-deoxy-phosphogluconate aldolase [Bacteroidota bacterium]